MLDKLRENVTYVRATCRSQALGCWGCFDVFRTAWPLLSRKSCHRNKSLSLMWPSGSSFPEYWMITRRLSVRSSSRPAYYVLRTTLLWCQQSCQPWRPR